MKQFLWLNGYALKAPEKNAENFTMVVGKEKSPIEEIAAWIEENAVHR